MVLLYSPSTPVSGKRPKLLNDLDIDSGGTIFVSDTSAKWELRNAPLLILESNSDGSTPIGRKELSIFSWWFALANGRAAHNAASLGVKTSTTPYLNTDPTYRQVTSTKDPAEVVHSFNDAEKTLLLLPLSDHFNLTSCSLCELDNTSTPVWFDSRPSHASAQESQMVNQAVCTVCF